MNVTNKEAPSNPMSREFGMNLPAPAGVEEARGKRASNDGALEAPIRAIDAMALCMKDSALGG